MNKFSALAAVGVLAAAAFFAVQASADDSSDSAGSVDSANSDGSAGENENSAFATMVATSSYSAGRATAHTTSHGAFGYKYKPGTLSRVSDKTSE